MSPVVVVVVLAETPNRDYDSPASEIPPEQYYVVLYSLQSAICPRRLSVRTRNSELLRVLIVHYGNYKNKK